MNISVTLTRVTLQKRRQRSKMHTSMDFIEFSSYTDDEHVEEDYQGSFSTAVSDYEKG